jgi:hypothetical protein
MSRTTVARHAVLVVLAALFGCTTVSQPVRTGKNTFLLEVKRCDGILFYSASCITAGINAINNFCEKRSLVATVAEKTPGALGHGIDFQFYCTDENHQSDSVLRPDKGVVTVQQR